MEPAIVFDAALGRDAKNPVRPLANGDAEKAAYFLGDSFSDGTAWEALTQAAARKRRSSGRDGGC